jgi:hypothetical protein
MPRRHGKTVAFSRLGLPLDEAATPAFLLVRPLRWRRCRHRTSPNWTGSSCAAISGTLRGCAPNPRARGGRRPSPAAHADSSHCAASGASPPRGMATRQPGSHHRRAQAARTATQAAYRPTTGISCLRRYRTTPWRRCKERLKRPFELARGGGQGRGRTADLPIFRARDAEMRVRQALPASVTCIAALTRTPPNSAFSGAFTPRCAVRAVDSPRVSAVTVDDGSGGV